jgi:transcriptional regulator with XRE-family HTH domain
MPVVARTLRELRIERGMSLRQLGDRSGLNKGTISQIERGRLVATPREVIALEVGLGLPIASLTVKTMVVLEEAARG